MIELREGVRVGQVVEIVHRDGISQCDGGSIPDTVAIKSQCREGAVCLTGIGVLYSNIDLMASKRARLKLARRLVSSSALTGNTYLSESNIVFGLHPL